MAALAIAAAMVLGWMLGILHPAIVGFIGAFLFLAVAGVEFSVAFAGFGTETPWFLYGALLTLGAATRSGLIHQVSLRTPRVLVHDPKGSSQGTPWLSFALLIGLAYGLAFVVPSSLARATILIVLALAWGGGLSILVAAYAAAMFGHSDMAGGPAAIVGWDIAAAVALFAAAWWLSRRAEHAHQPAPEHCPLTAAAAVVIVVIALWLTTPIHRLPPALVGLAGGLVCCLPGIGPRDRQSPAADHLALIFVGTAMSIPAVLEETRAAETLAHAWTSVNQGSPLVGYWTTVVYRMFSPEGARPALPPLAAPPGSTAIWAYAGSTLVSLHQSPALILAMALGGVRPVHVLTVGLFVLVLGSVVVLIF